MRWAARQIGPAQAVEGTDCDRSWDLLLRCEIAMRNAVKAR